MENKFDNKTIEYLIFRYFNVRNFEISKCQSSYISSFKILTPTRYKVEIAGAYPNSLDRMFPVLPGYCSP